MQTDKAQVEIKGTRRGVAITLPEGDWQALMRDLDERLTRGEAFFQGSQANLKVGEREVSVSQMQNLVTLLQGHNISLSSVETVAQETAEAARTVGIRLALPEVQITPSEGSYTADRGMSEGLLVRRTLRSGQSVRHAGHVIILGDVNPGAEIIAGGDVVVWGRLRGVVHAGAMGDEAAVVCALELMPMQLRIAGLIARSPESRRRKGVYPERASIYNGQIVAEPWDKK